MCAYSPKFLIYLKGFSVGCGKKFIPLGTVMANGWFRNRNKPFPWLHGFFAGLYFKKKLYKK